MINDYYKLPNMLQNILSTECLSMQFVVPFLYHSAGICITQRSGPMRISLLPRVVYVLTDEESKPRSLGCESDRLTNQLTYLCISLVRFSVR